MAGLRTMRGLDINATENANRTNLLGGKSAAAGLGKGVVTRRGALGDIANKAGASRQIGKEGKPLKPVRGTLTRQKGSVSIVEASKKQATEIPVRRRSARKSSEKNVEQMEVEETLQQDVEMAEVPALSSLDLAQIENIDLDDKENPQLAVEYVNEIYEYMRQLEAKQFIKKDYLEQAGSKGTIKPKMRNLLVDWLIEVHQQFSLLQETLYLTVALLDRFLQVKATSITTKQLQLVGVTAMFMAAKYEEMYPPEIGDFVYITDNAYSTLQIRQMEIEMVSSIKFELGRPLPLNFLRRNSKAGQVSASVHGMAKYVMELVLVEYKLAHIPPSIVAAASLAFSMRVLNPKHTPMRQLWTNTLIYYTSYTIDDLSEAISAIARQVIEVNKATETAMKTTDGKKKIKSVYKKYANRKFLKISLTPELQGDEIKNLADGEF